MNSFDFARFYWSYWMIFNSTNSSLPFRSTWNYFATSEIIAIDCTWNDYSMNFFPISIVYYFFLLTSKTAVVLYSFLQPICFKHVAASLLLNNWRRARAREEKSKSKNKSLIIMSSVGKICTCIFFFSLSCIIFFRESRRSTAKNWWKV